MIRPPPRSTLFPYTPLSRSQDEPARQIGIAQDLRFFKRTDLQRDALSLRQRPSRFHRLRGDVVQIQRLADDRQIAGGGRSEEHTSELQSQSNIVCRLLL